MDIELAHVGLSESIQMNAIEKLLYYRKRKENFHSHSRKSFLTSISKVWSAKILAHYKCVEPSKNLLACKFD